VSISLVPFLSLECILIAILVVVVFYRQSLARKEEMSLHVLQGSISDQTTLGAKLDKIEKLSRSLTIATVAGALLIALLFLYKTWTYGNVPS
jgi:hypothetical protein